MEEKNQHPDIDLSYIDQLLTTYTPKPEAPAPEAEEAPAQTMPVPAEPVQETAAPEKKRSKTPLLVLAAIGLLGLGFLAGRLSALYPVPEPDAATPSTYIAIYPGDMLLPGINDGSGIAVDYASMSTSQLASLAIQIPELANSFAVSTQLTPDRYAELKTKYPVLIELEQRPDAVEQLTFYNLISSSSVGNPAATALVRYYVRYLGFDNYPSAEPVRPDCEWILQSSGLFTVYEYTQAPSVYFMAAVGSAETATVFNFDGCEFYLQGDAGLPGENANFWYRVEYSSDAAPELTWINPHSSAWVDCRACDGGWFVYGYVPDTTDLKFAVDGPSIQLSVSPLPGTETASAVIVQSVFDRAETLLNLSNNNPEKKLETYPVVGALLAQPGGISALLNLIQEHLPSMYSSTIDFRYSNAVSLLQFPTFQDAMTADEDIAHQLLCGDSNMYFDWYKSVEPVFSETAEHFTLTDRPDLQIGSKPESLSGIPLSEMNYWTYVPLSEGAMILQQPGWTVRLVVPPGDDGQFGAWPVYDADGRLSGWIISGKHSKTISLQMDLMQGNTFLTTQFLPVTPIYG